MLTFVVMPCLDELSLVESAIASLGFLSDRVPLTQAHLIAVDNGSTDGTLELLAGIQAQHEKSVHIVQEPARGFVPPRGRGVREAQILARSMGAVEEEVLVLQADADTIYREGYVETMRRGAQECGTGVILEGSTKPPPGFASAHPTFLAAQRLVDDAVESLDAEDEQEVVLDDKICGYRLSDYFAWGGLFEEWTNDGDPIHAETTRMFIRARLRHGARKHRVNPAGAMPSRRKILEDPWLQYATVGFPREASWVRARHGGARPVKDVDVFASAILEGREPEAIYLRRAHQLALFRYLPALIDEVERVTVEGAPPHPEDVAAVLAALPLWLKEDVADQPGRALLHVLTLIDARPDLFGVR